MQNHKFANSGIPCNVYYIRHATQKKNLYLLQVYLKTRAHVTAEGISVESWQTFSYRELIKNTS